MSERTIDLIRTKEEWLGRILEQRNAIWNDSTSNEQVLAHVMLYCQKDPQALPGVARRELFVMMFAGHFYNGPDAVMPLEDFKEAWSKMICLTAVAGDAIASVTYQEVWHLMLKEGEKTPPDYSKDPRATEHLVFVANHRDFEQFSWEAQITHEDGKRVLAPWKKHGKVTGRLFDFIQPQSPTHMQQLKAATYLADLNREH